MSSHETPAAPAAAGNSPAPSGQEPEKSQFQASDTSYLDTKIHSPPSDSNAAPKALESHPMTASTSSSSEITVQDPANPSSTAPAPYGTRSRNRNGGSRPNYAEDRDMEDFEATGSTFKNGSLRGPPPAAPNEELPSTSDNDRSAGVSTRRTHVTGNGTPTSNGINCFTAIPGTSTFSANPNAVQAALLPSKKRKQPDATTTTPTNGVSVSAGSQTSTRRNGGTVASSGAVSDTNMMSFDTCQKYLKNGKLKADDGTTLGIDDHVYLICEPPGEPYYLARVMEFLYSKNETGGPVEALRVNWYYRPRDIQRKVTDTRVVFASMHSDTCPLTSLRGKCRIAHRNEIDDLDEYRKTKDSFWYEKMFDRYIHRYYEVIPTSQVINVPQHVKKVLDERWKFVIVEIGRGKELTSAVKTCKRCGGYCANHDSVDCAVCHDTYHMTCVRPVLQKKPARGFAWACGPCSRAQERKLEARNTPIVGESAPEALEAEEEIFDEEEEDPSGTVDATRGSSPAGGPGIDAQLRPATSEQIAQAKLWPYRYLGIHCRVEDALDYDDRIYPRASSRLGPRHQANVNVWHGHPVQLVPPADIKKRYLKSSALKKDAKLSKETIAAMEADKVERAKRPKWVMDEPFGYVRRGEDDIVNVAGAKIHTVELTFKMPDDSQFPSRGGDDPEDITLDISVAEREKFIDDYMEKAKDIAPQLGVANFSTNFLDKALQLLCNKKYNAEAALADLKLVIPPRDLKEPNLTKEEIKKFEEGVAKYGSELHSVFKHVKTVSEPNIVRFYYMWKKTERGRQIWGNYEGRRGKKEAKRADPNASKLVDDVADDHDDSAFDNTKAAEKKKGFECKFCSTRSSRLWRRAPGTAPGMTVPADSTKSKDKNNHLTVALCQRCAGLWRKYGIQWENIDEVAKKVAQGGGRAWKRRIDEELLVELIAANAASDVAISNNAAAAAASTGVPVPASLTVQSQEPLKKKAKTDKEGPTAIMNGVDEAVPKKKAVVEKPPEPALVPEPPKPKILPCAICDKMDPTGDEHLSCRDCRLTVHRSCYGVSDGRSSVKWVCDMCANDRNPSFSTSYRCVLCPVETTEHELMEPPKVSHKKKTDREREKERLEKDMVANALRLYRASQEAAGRPVGPREPLKRTSGNNWMHVVCAVWTPEVKFGSAMLLEPAEVNGQIPAERYQEQCKICKTSIGACVPCQYSNCTSRFHVGCAAQAKYIFGFDITPAKSSRRDVVNTIRLGEEVGSATAAIWCPNHNITTIVHDMTEPTEREDMTALQLYCETYKQADLTLTGTVRKAAYVQQSAVPSIQNAASVVNRRASTINGTHSVQSNAATQANTRSPRISPTESLPKSDEVQPEVEVVDAAPATSADESTKKCSNCSTTFSPRWWLIDRKERKAPANPRAIVDDGRSMANGTASTDSVALGKRPIYGDGPSASPPSTSHSQAGFAAASSTTVKTEPSALGIDGVMEIEPSEAPLYLCHKCHIKKPPPPSLSPEARPLSYPQHPALTVQVQAPPFTSPRTPPTQQTGVTWSRMNAGPHPGRDWPSEQDHRPEYGNPNLRNGVPPPQTNGITPGSAYHNGPPLPINGFAPPHPPQLHGLPHYSPNGIPPFSPRQQSSYGPMPPGQSAAGHPYPASPPHEVRTMHNSPQSITGPPRSYPVPRQAMERPTTPTMDERPGSSGRFTNLNGASASPSLRNLLS